MAADLICERLATKGITDMFRFQSYQRDVTKVSEGKSIMKVILRFSNFSKETFVEPKLSELYRHRFLICTCITAGKLYNLGFPSEYFDLILIDEAG